MPPRRTPADLAAYHAEQAEKHRVRALLAGDPILCDAVALRDLIAQATPKPDASTLGCALDAFIDGRTAK